jgi:hypothetical protein
MDETEMLSPKRKKNADKASGVYSGAANSDTNIRASILTVFLWFFSVPPFK